MPFGMDGDSILEGSALLEVDLGTIDTADAEELNQPRQRSIYLVELYPYVLAE